MEPTNSAAPPGVQHAVRHLKVLFEIADRVVKTVREPVRSPRAELYFRPSAKSAVLDRGRTLRGVRDRSRRSFLGDRDLGHSDAYAFLRGTETLGVRGRIFFGVGSGPKKARTRRFYLQRSASILPRTGPEKFAV